MSLDRYYAAEYAALKQEQVARIGLRETSLYMSLAINLSVLAVYFTEVGSKQPIPLIVPLVSFVMFSIYAFNDEMISRIRRYIVDELRGKVAETFRGTTTAASLFNWELYHRAKTIGHVVRKLFRIVVVWIAFSGLTLASLWISSPIGLTILSDKPASTLDILLAACWWAGAVSSALPYLLTRTLLDL